MNYKIISEIPNHNNIQNEITIPLWPEFILNDAMANRYWFGLFEHFPEFQITLREANENIGVANSIPVFWNEDLQKLPEEGWDWALEKGFKDKKAGRKPNLLVGLQIAVAKDHQGSGISSIILHELKKLAISVGMQKLAIPVRPSQKSMYPLISIDDYLNWKRPDGLFYDAWLRVHQRARGKLFKPCHRAMLVKDNIEKWQQWTGLKFKQSADYVVPGALNPVKFDVKAGFGEYVEPNVWVEHKLEG